VHGEEEEEEEDDDDDDDESMCVRLQYNIMPLFR
jgi:hypothetical protein